jgi:hypothetical protein
MELFSNRERWQEIKDFYIAKAELKHFIAELEGGTLPKALPPAKEEPKEVIELAPDPNDNPVTDLLKELNEHLRGKENRPFP